MPRAKSLQFFFVLICGFAIAVSASGADWPMWRCDANRSAASPAGLPEQLHLQWKRELHPPRPAFAQDIRLCFDLSYEPVVMGGAVFTPSMVTDSMTALDTRTGAEKWTFYADGPVRFAPLAWRGKVYFVSDDGYLYCVNADSGELVWRFSRQSSSWMAQRLLGNERLISRWPARGGPVLADGTVYFAAGVWPAEGTYVCAVDAETGELVWANKDAAYIKDGLIDHGARRNGGLSPQGYLAVIGERLIVPSGRALPGFFDRKTGEMEPYTTGWGGRVALAKGSWYVAGVGDYLVQSGDFYALSPPRTGRERSPSPTMQTGLTAEEEKPNDLVSVEQFAQEANVSLETVEKWIKERPLETVERDGKRFIRVRTCPPINYVSWWPDPKRPGEQYVASNRPRLEIDPANDKGLSVFREPVLTEKAIYFSRPVHDASGGGAIVRRPADTGCKDIVACDITSRPKWGITYQGGWGTPERIVQWKTAAFDLLWSFPSKLKVHIKAGPRLYAGGAGVVAAVDMPAEGGDAKVSWQAEIEGTPSRMLAADDRLFVVTQEGAIYCFGGEEVEAKSYAIEEPRFASVADERTERAAGILKQTGVREGYCLVLGVGTGRLVEELARQSELRLIVLDSDAKKVDAARRKFGEIGIYGTRVHVVPGDLLSLQLPPYLASLAVSEDVAQSGLKKGRPFVERLFHSMRPYGGVACLAMDEKDHAALAGWVNEAGLAGAEVTRAGDLTLLTRQGPLPGAADWTHQRGDAGNTYTSSDVSVKPPFGVLWFGGAPDRIVGVGPRPPLASGGRMFFVIGKDVHATDIYTGRHLWKASLASAGDYAAAEDGVYVACGTACLWLDPADGSKRAEIVVPVEGKRPGWREVRVWGDYLVGTAGKGLFCMDRHTAKPLWSCQSRQDAFAFAVGGDRVFCVDYWLPVHQRRGEEKTEQSTIYALDAPSGKVLWQSTARTPIDLPDEVAKKKLPRPLNPQLSYCEASDILLLSARLSTIGAYDGKTGEALWTGDIACIDPPTAFTSPELPILLPRLLISHGGQLYDPRTGSPLPKRLWKGANAGTRGCGRALANPHIVVVRDAYVSYFDLADGRQGFFCGIRSGCLNALILADGLLSAPNYARHCTCNYPIYISFALVPMLAAPEWAVDH